jgi:hypothetical protein
MKRYLGVVIAAVGFLFVVVFAVGEFRKVRTESARDLNMARVHRDYLERVGWIRSNPDERSYKDEVGTFFRWYFKEVNEHLNRHQGNRNFDGYLTELQEKKDPQAAEKKARYDYVKRYFDQFRSGDYTPVWSSTDKGMRLDISSAGIVNAGGQEKIRLSTVLWGAQREMKDKGMVTRASYNITWKLFDEKGKLYAEQTMTGDPAMKIDWPERLIPEFPPQMVLGHFDLDILPAEAVKSEMHITVSSASSSGGSINSTHIWRMDIPAEWKLKPGQKWEGAQESVRPEDEIDPSKSQALK